MITPLQWKDVLYLLDQRKLPVEEVWVPCSTVEEVARAIRDMVVRGAPAIGITAGFGVVLGAREGMPWEEVKRRLASTRPTARNLFWALERMERVWEETSGNKDALEREAVKIWEEDVQANRRMGKRGAELLKEGKNFLTICNAGALATGGYGTALGVIRALHEKNPSLRVFAPETRPYLQGARLTTWELQKDGIPVTLITDNMVGFLMKEKEIHGCIVGADRIAQNGDTANKIGTYQMALLAKNHGVPFYVVAPESTVDRSLSSGEEIPIEYRGEEEVCLVGNTRIAPFGVSIWHPAFDVTPASLITAIITEKAVYQPPFSL